MEIGKSLIFVVLVVALLAIGAYMYVNSEKQTITVSGSSKITSAPDLVSVYINIETLNLSAEKAKQENAEITNKVINELKALNFKDNEIETLSWNINEDYSWENRQRVFKGYKVSNRIKVSVKNYDFVGIVVDKIVDSGALVNSIQFELSKEHEKELKAEALEEATKDAKTKAESVARGSNKKLGKLISAKAIDYYYNPYILYDYAEGSSENVKTVATHISPRDLSVTGNIQAVYSVW